MDYSTPGQTHDEMLAFRKKLKDEIFGIDPHEGTRKDVYIDMPEPPLPFDDWEPIIAIPAINGRKGFHCAVGFGDGYQVKWTYYFDQHERLNPALICMWNKQNKKMAAEYPIDLFAIVEMRLKASRTTQLMSASTWLSVTFFVFLALYLAIVFGMYIFPHFIIAWKTAEEI
ncbi:hypothetical protein C8034_v005662 [Colletotrichum sidae]|uniref:Uncharacterized protein n=1 Tax=Colletotrichum sidae TaxID=1347389 RepID=A0A4R8TS56_9PEZI|nr:hypothetical protein C8034_v005662 [Colletotrichum sidae]